MASAPTRAGYTRRRLVAAGAAAFIAAAALSAPAHADGAPVPAVTCTYTFTAWNGGFTADLRLANSGPEIDGWTVHWTFPVSTSAVSAWSSFISVHDGIDVTATNASYNATILSGTSVTFGWTAQAAFTAVPVDLTVNGSPC